jgi:hypothetical protein
MRNIAALFLVGILLLAFGCPEEAPQEQPEPEGPAKLVENESTLLPVVEENITQCFDGTLVGKCSVTKPRICDIYGNLVNDAETCGCPPNSLKRGKECIFNCEDGTPIGECSGEKPLYCNREAELEGKASVCGCPPGYDISGEGCRNSCDDGTFKYACSEATPPYYCNGDYELVMNPLVCGCNDWEFLLGTSCYDPSTKKYSDGETIRLSESLNMKVDKVKSINCDDGSYVKLQLTVENQGDEAVNIQDYNFKLFRDQYRMNINNRPAGCTVADLFKWGSVGAGKTEAGYVWFKILGGTGGVYHAEYLHQYSPTVIKEFYISLDVED